MYSSIFNKHHETRPVGGHDNASVCAGDWIKRNGWKTQLW